MREVGESDAGASLLPTPGQTRGHPRGPIQPPKRSERVRRILVVLVLAPTTPDLDGFSDGLHVDGSSVGSGVSGPHPHGRPGGASHRLTDALNRVDVAS